MKKSLIFFSFTMILIVSTVLTLIFFNRNVEEDNDPESTGSKESTVFNVETFGSKQVELEKDIALFLTKFPITEWKAEDLINTVKIDESGVALVDFNHSLIKALDDTMSTATAGELMRGLNSQVFSYKEIQTVYYLIDGDFDRWCKWLEITKEPIIRSDLDI